MKKIDLNLQQLKRFNRNPDWQRGLLTSAILGLLIFAIMIGYLFFKPVDKNVRAIIDEEISSIDIIFDTKTIDMINKRQQPGKISSPEIGKNPFIPF